MSVVTLQARRAVGLLVACLVLSLSQTPRTQEAVKVQTRQLVQIDPAGGEGGDAAGQAAAEALATAPPARPLNVSGTYRGSWGKKQLDPALAGSFLSRESGMVVFKLTTTPSFRPEVHNVLGELVLRDGLYASEADVLLRVQGVYIADVGKVLGVLEPVNPISLPLLPHDALHLADYRHALRQAASNWLRLSESGSSSYRGVAAAAAIGEAAKFSKQCAFSLELVARHANRSQLEQQQGGQASSAVALGKQLGQQANGGSVEDLIVNGTITSSNCGVVLELNATTTHVEQYYAKAINYTVMITALAFTQIMLLVKQMEASSTQALASKVSLLTIAQQAVLDAYLCLLHLTVGVMVEPLFNAFATAAFTEFVIFAIFEMRFLLSIWRARQSGSLDPWTAQRELSILYGRFYGALLGGILMSYYLQRFMKVAVFLLHSFWIPQIVLCVRTDSRQPLKPLYVVGMSLARLALPLYLYACPKNLLRVEPSPWVCVCLTIFVGAQAAVLLAQHMYGPRCFIPKRFLPPKYDYYRAAMLAKGRHSSSTCDIETGDAGTECLICLSPLDISATSQRMVTPCDHFFHPSCLQRWMQVKQECPTCRRALPPE